MSEETTDHPVLISQVLDSLYEHICMENMVMYPPPRISGLSLYITLFLRVFKILSIISMHSFTKYELHEEVTHINENIAAGFPPLEMFTC